MKKVTGLGGVFFKCDNPQGMNEWYARVNHSSDNDYMAIAMGLKPTVLKIYYYAH